MSVFIAFIILLWSISASALTVTASGYVEPNRPANVIDGGSRTHWTCRGECTLTMDLGQEQPIESVTLLWLRPDLRTASFELLVSADGATWNEVFAGETGDVNNYETYTFPEEVARYVKVVCHGNSMSDHNSIEEMSVGMGRDVNRSFDPVEVTASGHQKANVPWNAYDFNHKTHWTGLAIAWIQFDLGEVYFINNVKIAWLNASTRQAVYDVEVSEDGTTWELVGDEVMAGKFTADKILWDNVIFIDEMPARYIRITGHGNNAKDPAARDKNSITEVVIEGHWDQVSAGDERI